MAASSDISLVLSALFAGAIDIADMRAWADRVLEAESDAPTWVVELGMYDSALPGDVYRVLGFSPESRLSPEEECAVLYRAFLRGRLPVDDAVHALEQIWCGPLSPAAHEPICSRVTEIERLRASGQRAAARDQVRGLLETFREHEAAFFKVFPEGSSTRTSYK